MEYGRLLIDKAAKVCGSRYALAKRLGINESNLAQVYAGRRKFPTEWAGPMAVLAGVEPGEAVLRILAERAGGKPSLGGMAAAIGGAATLLFSYTSSVGQSPKFLSVMTACIDCLRIVSMMSTLRPGRLKGGSLRDRACGPSTFNPSGSTLPA